MCVENSWFSSGLTSDGYLCADGQPPGSKDYEEHQYVNTQNLENLNSWGPEGYRGARAPDSPKKDLFDMSKSWELEGHILTAILKINSLFVFENIVV